MINFPQNPLKVGEGYTVYEHPYSDTCKAFSSPLYRASKSPPHTNYGVSIGNTKFPKVFVGSHQPEPATKEIVNSLKSKLSELSEAMQNQETDLLLTKKAIQQSQQSSAESNTSIVKLEKSVQSLERKITEAHSRILSLESKQKPRAVQYVAPEDFEFGLIERVTPKFSRKAERISFRVPKVNNSTKRRTVVKENRKQTCSENKLKHIGKDFPRGGQGYYSVYVDKIRSSKGFKKPTAKLSGSMNPKIEYCNKKVDSVKVSNCNSVTSEKNPCIPKRSGYDSNILENEFPGLWVLQAEKSLL